MTEGYSLRRRVAGYHDLRLDGVSDLLHRAAGMSVLDVGCNRGMVGFEFAQNGATLIHGCDIFERGIETAREITADSRAAKFQFEVVDLSLGPSSLDVFGGVRYDVVLLLAVLHKLRRVMDEAAFEALVTHFGAISSRYVVWRATVNDGHENKTERVLLDRVLGAAGFRRAHYSELSDLGPAGIWERKS